MKLSYRVTEKAGRRVNGQRVVAGQIVTMTEGEARYYLDLQELEPAPAPSPAARAPVAKR
jgi:hypothetical protein